MKSFISSGTPLVVPARGRPEAITTARLARPTCGLQSRQHLRLEHRGQREQPPEQRRLVGYQPCPPQPTQQVVLGKLRALSSAQQRGERARQAHDVAIRIRGRGRLHDGGE